MTVQDYLLLEWMPTAVMALIAVAAVGVAVRRTLQVVAVWWADVCAAERVAAVERRRVAYDAAIEQTVPMLTRRGCGR